MIKNYLKVALRNIRKHKGFFFINVVGLSMGIVCSVLILLFVTNEQSYDKFNEKADRIFRLAVRASIGDTKINQTHSSSETFRKLIEEFPEIEMGVKFLNLGRTPITFDEKTFYESRFFAVDESFYEIFSIPLIHGDLRTVLKEPNTMVLSKDTALKYFGHTNIIGNVLIASNGSEDRMDFKITGVSENVPENSHFHYDLLVSSSSFPNSINDTGWSSNRFITYLLLNEGTSQTWFDEKLKDFTRKYMGGEKFDSWVAQGNYWEYFLQPITEIHLTSDLNGEFETNGNRTYVTIFFVISVVILLIACINFMNLSTAKSSLRAKEVGMRKVVGSSRSSLVGQFLGESILLSYISLALGMVAVWLLLPKFSNLIGRELEIHYFDNFLVVPLLLALGLFVGIVSGSYPAFVLSSFKPVAIFRGSSGEKKSGAWMRNALVIFQFSISIFLIIGTLVVYQQLEHFQHVKLGFEKEQVLVVKNPGSLGDNVFTFKETLRGNSQILNVSGSNSLPGRDFSNIGFGAEGVEESFTLNLCVSDYDFLETLKLEMASGRYFSREFGMDSHAVVINEKAADLLGWDDPIGKKMNNWSTNRGNFTVIGVIKDYHYESLHQTIRPQALFLSGGYYTNNENYISVRLNTENITETRNFVEKTWNNFAPNMPFEYSFLDQDYDNLYINEKQTRKLFTVFSVLAIFYSLSGSVWSILIYR
ncbi:ABC transporter permease [Acidobacteriota bacterium]